MEQLSTHSLHSSLKESMNQVKHTLPLTFLGQHDLGGFATSKGVQKILGTFDRIMLEASRHGFDRWRRGVEIIRLEELTAAARVVQREWRGGAVRDWAKQQRYPFSEQSLTYPCGMRLLWFLRMYITGYWVYCDWFS